MGIIELEKLLKLASLLLERQVSTTLHVWICCSKNSRKDCITFVGNVSFHFINNAMFVFKTTSFPSAEPMERSQHRHACRSVQPEFSQDNPIPKETLDFFLGPLRCVVCCPIFLKITKWQFLVIQVTYRLFKTVEVDISLDCCVEENGLLVWVGMWQSIPHFLFPWVEGLPMNGMRIYGSPHT